MRTFLRDNGLTIVLMLMFAASLLGQLLFGWHFENEELGRHGERSIGIAEYASDPHFIATVFENWESEFLQMAVYVILTAVLFQRGSAESRDPDEPPRDDELVGKPLRRDAPRILRASNGARLLFEHSLGIALALLFVASFALHWIYSAKEAAAEAISHGQEPLTTLAYLGSPQLWFESFQNWQSEFLSTAVLVVLSIFLRQRNSPESKAVTAAHSETGA